MILATPTYFRVELIEKRGRHDTAEGHVRHKVMTLDTIECTAARF